jgi:putative Ca2+/H+ antiporter (TMEM165/GDT1 family)
MKELITTFITIFLAEMGDKTQFAVMCFATKSLKPINIYLGATLAFLVTNLISVILGVTIAKIFPHQYIKYISGLLFILIGTLTILSK